MPIRHYNVAAFVQDIGSWVTQLTAIGPTRGASRVRGVSPMSQAITLNGLPRPAAIVGLDSMAANLDR